MGLIELDKELATAVKSSLESIKVEIQTNLNSAPTSLKDINPNSSQFIIKEKKKVTYNYTTVDGEEKEAYYYRTVVKADYTQNALNYDSAYTNFTTRVTEIRDAITEKIDKVTTALQTVLDLVNTFESQEGVSMSSALGDASENTFEFLAAYGDASSLTSLVGPGTFGTTSLDNIYEIEDDEEAIVDSSFLNLNNPDAEGLSEAEQQTIDFVLSQLKANGCINEETGEVIIDGNVVGTLDRVSVNALLATTLGVTIKANMEKDLSAEAYEYVNGVINYKGLEPGEGRESLLNIRDFEGLNSALSNGVGMSAAITSLLANFNIIGDSHLYGDDSSVTEEISLYLSLVGENSELFSDEVAGESFAYLAEKAGWPGGFVSSVISGGSNSVAISNVATKAHILELESALSMPDKIVDMALKKRLDSGADLTYEQRLEIVNDYAEQTGIKLPESVVIDMVNDLGDANSALGEIVDNFVDINEQLGFGRPTEKFFGDIPKPEINVTFAERYLESAAGELEVNVPSNGGPDTLEWWNNQAEKIKDMNTTNVVSGVLVNGGIVVEGAEKVLESVGTGASSGLIGSSVVEGAVRPGERGPSAWEEALGTRDKVVEIVESTTAANAGAGAAITQQKVQNTGGGNNGTFVKETTHTNNTVNNYGGNYNNQVRVDPPRQPQPEPPRQPQPEPPRQSQPAPQNPPQQSTQPSRQEHHHSSNPTGVADVPKIEDVFNNEPIKTPNVPEINSNDELKSSAIIGAAGIGATTVLGSGSSLPNIPNVPNVPNVSAPGVAITPSAPTMAPTPNPGMSVTTGPDMMIGQDLSSAMSQGTLNAGPVNSTPAVNNAANSNVNSQAMAQNAALNNNTNSNNAANANNSSNANSSTHTTQSSSSKGELGKGKSSYSGGSSEGSSSSKSKSENIKNKAHANDDVENDVENNNHEAEIDPNATEGVLSDSAYVQMLAREEKQVKIATATTSSVGLLMFALKFADVLTWGSLGLSAGALGLFYTSFRVHKAKKIKKIQHLIIIEREERIRKLKDRNERLIVIENTKQKDLEAISDVQKIESKDKKEETTEVSKKEEQAKKNVKNELDEKQTTVSQEENIHVSEENTEIVSEIEEVTEPEGYGSIVIPDGDEAFQSAEEVIFGEIPDRFSKDEIVEDNQENK